MCSVDAYDKEHISIPDVVSSDGGRPMPSKSSKESLLSLGHTINFIENWLQCFEVNYQNIMMICKRRTSELFKTTPKTLLPKNLMIIRKKVRQISGKNVGNGL